MKESQALKMLGKLSGRKAAAEPQANGEMPVDPAKLAAELGALQAENRRMKALVMLRCCLAKIDP